MKAFPLILIGVLCLAFGWFAHYSLVPETTYITDTLIKYDTVKYIEFDHSNRYSKLMNKPFQI